jgi:hypothetical protein
MIKGRITDKIKEEDILEAKKDSQEFVLFVGKTKDGKTKRLVGRHFPVQCITAYSVEVSPFDMSDKRCAPGFITSKFDTAVVRYNEI